MLKRASLRLFGAREASGSGNLKYAREMLSRFELIDGRIFGKIRYGTNPEERLIFLLELTRPEKVAALLDRLCPERDFQREMRGFQARYDRYAMNGSILHRISIVSGKVYRDIQRYKIDVRGNIEYLTGERAENWR